MEFPPCSYSNLQDSNHGSIARDYAPGLASSLDLLPDEIQCKILSHLPTNDAVQCESVCKQWQTRIKALATFPTADGDDDALRLPLQNPFYLMFNSEKPYLRKYLYKSDKERWVPFQIPNTSDQDQDWPEIFNLTCFSASRGLVCFTDAAIPDCILVCNPLLKDQMRMLPAVPGDIAHYCTLALSTDVSSKQYTIAAVKSTQVQVDTTWFVHKVTIHIYKSEAQSWAGVHSENTAGWLADESSVICGGTLYCVIRFPYILGDVRPCHAIASYDLSQPRAPAKQSLANTMMHVPCALTCARLLNLNDKLVLVGGIQKCGRSELETVGIWQLWRRKQWREIARAPRHKMKAFGEAVDERFICGGCGPLVFIQTYTSRALLVFNFDKKIWVFAPKPPLYRERDDLVSGFCFEPRLDIRA